MTTKELIELIRAEIKKRRLHFDKEAEKFQAINNGYSRKCYGARNALRDLENFLDTLPDEPVITCDQLEEEIKEQIYERFYDLHGIAVVGTSGYAEVKDMEDIARHFAEWMKKKMMEGAVEGEVCILPGYVAYVKEKNNESLKQYLLDNFKVGDKVSIIILPKED